MSKKAKAPIKREDNFTEVDAELASAMELLDDANTRIESLLRTQNLAASEETDETPSGGALAPETTTEA